MSFDIEKLNSRMNCNCLQSIIENEKKIKYNYNTKV